MAGSALQRRSDVLLAGGVLVLLAVMLIPVSPILLDLFLIGNLAFALTTLALTIYVRQPLQFNTFPTVLELAFVCGVLAYTFNIWFAVVVGVTVIAYMSFTYQATEWRIEIRRRMNEADTDANTKAIDSLLNFETVKYFGNEKHESERFDVSMERYERAATKTFTSLAVLNSGQAVIFSVGLTICMIMAGFGIANGTMTVGDFVMVNAFLIQLYIPLNFLGTVYRDIKQGLIDVETMFDLLDVEPEIQDKPDAKPLELTDAGLEDPLIGELPASFLAQEGHKDRVTRNPEGIPNLAGSTLSPRQAFRVPGQPIWATQFHPELDRTANLCRFDHYVAGYARHMDEGAQHAARARFQESPETSKLLPRFLELVFG